MPMKIYYAHHLWKYGTDIEVWGQNLIAEHFPQCEIVNPTGRVYATVWTEKWVVIDE